MHRRFDFVAGLRAVVSQAGPFYVLKLLGGSEGDFVTALGQGSQLVLGQHYSREHEREADNDGWQLLQKARIDPRGLASALRKFQTWEEEVTDNRGRIALEEKADRLLSSHPPTPERVQYLDELWEKSAKPSSFTRLPKLELTVPGE